GRARDLEAVRQAVVVLVIRAVRDAVAVRVGVGHAHALEGDRVASLLLGAVTAVVGRVPPALGHRAVLLVPVAEVVAVGVALVVAQAAVAVHVHVGVAGVRRDRLELADLQSVAVAQRELALVVVQVQLVLVGHGESVAVVVGGGI